MDESTRDTPSQIGSLSELREMLKEFDTAMLVTVTPDGRLRSRPMALQDPALVPDADLWFVSAEDSGKIEEIREDRQVNVSCLRSRDKAYISISAIARIDNNPAEVGRLWKSDWKIWMSEEPSDGSISILKLTVEEAEYWQPEGGRLRVLYSIVKSLLNDEPAEKSLNPPKRIV